MSLRPRPEEDNQMKRLYKKVYFELSYVMFIYLVLLLYCKTMGFCA